MLMLTLLEAQEPITASGTSWQPPSTPMFMFHHDQHGAWTAMLHGNVFAGVDVQGSDRGETSVESINNIMGMVSRPVAGDAGWLGFRAMLSAEPWTVGDAGYPLLLQTGETRDGEPLHDVQHPHDLFMELSATTRWALGKEVGVELYAAPAGEPAIGPTAFMHRVSAISNPLAPLGHHWMDSTHITYGVATLGVFGAHAKLEGSWFNGREPDATRYDFDFASFDSASIRLSGLIGDDLALQVSYAWLGSPEALHPGPVQRTTASATWNHPWAQSRANAATTAAWGRNVEQGEAPSDSVLVETNVDPVGPLVVFGRGSFEEKSARDLVVEGVPEETSFDLYTAEGGLVVMLPVGRHIETGVGVRGNVSLIPEDLEPAYGTRTPAGLFVFLQLRPPPMAQAVNGEMHHHH